MQSSDGHRGATRTPLKWTGALGFTGERTNRERVLDSRECTGNGRKVTGRERVGERACDERGRRRRRGRDGRRCRENLVVALPCTGSGPAGAAPDAAEQPCGRCPRRADSGLGVCQGIGMLERTSAGNTRRLPRSQRTRRWRDEQQPGGDRYLTE